jgi:hypothetical protein
MDSTKIGTDKVFVSFHPLGERYIASMSLEGVLNDWDPEATLRDASALYEDFIRKARTLMCEIAVCRSQKRSIPARKVWRLGDAIFAFVEALRRSSLEIDGLYDHLTRDLNVTRGWLEKVIIFRRYMPEENLIPSDASWGRLRNRPKSAALGLLKLRQCDETGSTDGRGTV